MSIHSIHHVQLGFPAGNPLEFLEPDHSQEGSAA